VSSKTDNWCFIHIPKTGGSSIEAVIGGAGHDDVIRYRPGHEFPVYAVVRNPWSRLVSAWKHHLVYRDNGLPYLETFEELVDDLPLFMWALHLRPQWTFLVTQFSEQHGNLHLGCYELLEDFYKRFMRITGYHPVELPHKRKALDTTHWSAYYTTPSMYDKVAYYYEQDFNLWEQAKDYEV
jgi:hypothetical protein